MAAVKQGEGKDVMAPDDNRGKLPASGSVLDGLSAGVRAAVKAEGGAKTRKLPPVHLWNPPFCGDIDMRIASDGTWFYLGTPIGRPALVRLFSTVLRKDAERFVLVTPVERVGIQVDDAPFVAVEMRRDGEGETQNLTFRTNVDDEVLADREHPLRFERDAEGGLKPYILVRDALWAKVVRAVTYDLVELGEERVLDGVRTFGLRSGGMFFPMAPSSELDEAR